MAKSNLLSICIPTYKRPGFLADSLKKISSLNGVSETEIVIVDDASNDETSTVIKAFIKNNSSLNIVHKKFTKRHNFDPMILSIMKYAHGEYCWLISDDDLPEKDSFVKIIGIIKKHPNASLIHVNYSRFDNLLKKITADKMVGDINKDILFFNKDKFFFKRIRKSYFQYLGTNVITMSTNIVNRKMWLNSLGDLDKFIGHNFMHCFVIAKMLAQNPTIYYVAEPMVRYLSNNHRIWPNDIWKDYNSVLLGYMGSLGFSKAGISEMRHNQKKYENREGVMKNPVLKHVYNLTKPIHPILLKLMNLFDL